MDDKVSTGCILPMVQALITGFMLGVLVLAVGTMGGWSQAAYVALAVGAAAGLWWWWSSIRSWRRYMFEEPEPMPVVPAPAVAVAEPRTFRVVVTNGAKMQFAEFEGVAPDQLKRLSIGLLDGLTFSEGNWTGAGRPFSKAQFRQLRDTFISRGWLRWRNPESPAQGLVTTAAGMAVLRYFAGAEVDPPPYRPHEHPDFV